MQIAYDASANSTCSSPNEYLETAPPLQNLLRNVLVRSRFFPVALRGDIKQAILQKCIKEEGRDALRFHWIKDKHSKQIETL